MKSAFLVHLGFFKLGLHSLEFLLNFFSYQNTFQTFLLSGTLCGFMLASTLQCVGLWEHPIVLVLSLSDSMNVCKEDEI